MALPSPAQRATTFTSMEAHFTYSTTHSSIETPDQRLIRDHSLRPTRHTLHLLNVSSTAYSATRCNRSTLLIGMRLEQLDDKVSAECARNFTTI